MILATARMEGKGRELVRARNGPLRQARTMLLGKALQKAEVEGQRMDLELCKVCQDKALTVTLALW